MYGKTMLRRLKRLSGIREMRDVEPLTIAQFPGAHCPLMGAAMGVRG